jgi:hypothetical protein
MALPYPQPDPATNEWNAFALKRNLDYLDQTQVQQGLQRLSMQVGSVGTSGSGETTLFSYAMPANQLAQDGQRLDLRTWGTTAANGNNKFWRIYLGATVLYLDNGAHNGIDWFIETLIIRTGSQTQTCVTLCFYEATSPFVKINSQSASEDLRTTLDVAITGEGSSSNDIVGQGFELIWLP